MAIRAPDGANKTNSPYTRIMMIFFIYALDGRQWWVVRWEEPFSNLNPVYAK